MTATKLRPFTTNAAPIPIAAIVTPAIAGPAIRAMLNIAEFRATAFATSSRPTISMTKAWRTGMSTAFAQPRRSARTTIIQTCTMPVSVRAASTNARSIIATCTARSVGFFGNASAMTPPKSPSRRTGTNWTAATMPRSSGLFVSVRTSQPCATDCIHVPMSETSCPPKKSR